MQDLYARSINNLDKKDYPEFFSLLNRFQHVFAKDDFDLELFNEGGLIRYTLMKIIMKFSLCLIDSNTFFQR